jgi:hypothetical protein
MWIGHSRRRRPFAHVFVVAAVALIAATLSPCSSAADYNEQTLYRFCPEGGCTDGAWPYAGLIIDGAGNLYGTTLIAGVSGHGVVFQLTPDETGTTWTETVLYSFCSQTPNCADGSLPRADLIMDGAGNLYGTTLEGGNGRGGGGTAGGGVVFQLTPDQTGTAWTETVLYSFCSQSTCTDGERPFAGLIMDGAGNLYGTTQQGGNAGFSGHGVVFRLSPDETGTVWTETVLYSFCSQTNCADGAGPQTGLIMDGAGNLYGTTIYGSSGGVVFQLSADETGTAWTETVLYSFCSQTKCPDGANPAAGLIMDGTGNLYGTTLAGNDRSCGPTCSIGRGVVFQLTPDETGTAININRTAAEKGAYEVAERQVASYQAEDGATPAQARQQACQCRRGRHRSASRQVCSSRAATRRCGAGWARGGQPLSLFRRAPAGESHPLRYSGLGRVPIRDLAGRWRPVRCGRTLRPGV